MTNVQSKLLPISATCKEYVHPWTDSCWNSTAGLMIQASQHSMRIYVAVYLLSLLMRGRIPSKSDLKRTILGILQSTAFLTTNGFSYVMFTCFLRNILGNFNFLSIAYIPAFLASFVALYIERPTRRALLTLYVANVATETIWNMLASRGYVRSIANGQAIIFGLSSSILLYYFRLGLHKTYKDSLFDICRFVIGRNEEGPLKLSGNSFADEMIPRLDVDIVDENEYNEMNNGELLNEIPDQQQENREANNAEQRPNSGGNCYINISNIVRVYSRLIKFMKTPSECCPHNNSCIYYCTRGGLKLFTVGLILQVTLKLALQIRKLIQFRLQFRKTILNKNTLKLGMFLGGFSFIYKSLSCTLRHLTGRDDSIHAIPAGILASIAFTQYPDNTVALYVLWKMFQISYNIGIEKGLLPKVPGFGSILYSASTAVLFHAATFEPLNLRPSYWKFLHGLSGGRVSAMDRRPLDAWGLESTKSLEEVMKLTQTFGNNIKFAFS